MEKTYKEQWSEDPELLKSLLDAKNVIIGYADGTLYSIELLADGDYFMSADSGCLTGEYEEFEDLEEEIFGYLNIKFLVPSHIQPKQLEWLEDENSGEFATQDSWSFEANCDGSWTIFCENKFFISGKNPGGNTISAKESIHQWRVEHLKSML